MAAPESKTDRCRSCGREIIWAKSPSGARLPLTARPVTVYTIYNGEALKVSAPSGGGTYISHFVDCPQAGEHSGRPRDG